HVDALVGALRREDRRDQQLVGVGEVERDLRVGIRTLEGREDLAYPCPLGHRRLAHRRSPYRWLPIVSASSRTATGPICTGNGMRAARRGVGSKLRTTQFTSRSGTGTPPTRTRSASSANGRSEAGSIRMRALTSGPDSGSVIASASPAAATVARRKCLSPV